mgnify:FL=1
MRDAPPEVREDPWIRRAEEEDLRINERIREIRVEHEAFSEKEVLQKAAEEIRERFAPDIKKRRDAAKTEEPFFRQIIKRVTQDQETPVSPTGDEPEKTDAGTRDNTDSNTETASPASADKNILSPRPQSVEIRNSAPADTISDVPLVPKTPVPERTVMEPAALPKEIIEFQPLALKVILVFSSGERRDVTREAQWQVIGPVGFFKSPGEFIPRLDESVAELGEGFGTVIAVWKDIKTGKEFIASSPAFKVVPPLESAIDLRG